MKIKETYTVQFPSYALCALFNGDLDGLEQEDVNNFEDFLKRYEDVDVWDDKEPDQEAYFSRSPEFGLACNVVDLTGVVFDKE